MFGLFQQTFVKAYLIEPQLCQTGLVLFNTLQPLKLILIGHLSFLARRVLVMILSRDVFF